MIEPTQQYKDKKQGIREYLRSDRGKKAMRSIAEHKSFLASDWAGELMAEDILRVLEAVEIMYFEKHQEIAKEYELNAMAQGYGRESQLP